MKILRELELVRAGASPGFDRYCLYVSLSQVRIELMTVDIRLSIAEGSLIINLDINNPVAVDL
jgi:hypothetical protein